MRRKKLIQCLTQTEKILLTFLGVALFFSIFQIGRAFYLENTDALPVTGGNYTEGAVGRVGVLNPLFIQQGTLTHDLTRLIFSGLTKYDPKTGDIVPDLANFEISSNGQEYTFVIKEGAFWHDGTPVTSNDVFFTYNDIMQAPDFTGSILNYVDYSGVKVVKMNEKTVQFLLEKPDSFFLSKTTVGLLPEHLLNQELPALLETSAFNFNPVGTGPYQFMSQVNMPEYIEYNLIAFEDYYEGKPNIDNIVFKVFDNYELLKENISELDGIRTVPPTELEDIEGRNSFDLKSYHLPQYVAVFINNESEILKETKVRLALQLGTDKESLVQAIGETKVIDTPFLEIAQGDWRQQYSVSKANGALFDTQWQIPNKESLELDEDEEADESSENEDEAGVNYITGPNDGKDWQTTRSIITITGTAPENTESVIIRESDEDYELQKFSPGDSAWSYAVREELGNLKEGENLYQVYAIDPNGERTFLDEIIITYGSVEEVDEEEIEKIKEENKNAQPLPTRVNEDDEPLVLNLITTPQPLVYQDVAQILKNQWQKIGVEININILDTEIFQQRLIDRDYDLLLFGQNLGYNPDTYPYWHSSQAKKEDEEVVGLNLSQFKNFVADTYLQQARLELDEELRKETLQELQSLMSDEVPAVFLYSPTYYSAFSDNIENVNLDNLATPTDRLALIGEWNSTVDRRFKQGTNFFTFFSWIFTKF